MATRNNMREVLLAQQKFTPPAETWKAPDARGVDYGYWEAAVVQVGPGLDESIEVTHRGEDHSTEFRFYFWNGESFLRWVEDAV